MTTKPSAKAERVYASRRFILVGSIIPLSSLLLYAGQLASSDYALIICTAIGLYNCNRMVDAYVKKENKDAD